MDELNPTPQNSPLDGSDVPTPEPQISQPVLQIEPPMAVSASIAPPKPTAGMPTNTLAVLSLVFSISSWILLWGVGGIAGLVLGIMARNEIKNNYGTQSGDGLALTGIILGAANIVVVCLGLMCVMAGVAFLASTN